MSKSDDKIVKEIIKRYGEVINIKESPEVILDILRRFPLHDDGGLPGGVPPPPPPPPGPNSFGTDPTLRDLMKEVLKLSKAVANLTKQVGAAKR